MAQAPETTTSRRPRLRVLATDYRTRLLLAIVFVVAVALSLVLISLPRLLEGYPVETEGRMPSASAYTGTRGMFERAGFTEASATTSKASGGRPRVVMRRPA